MDAREYKQRGAALGYKIENEHFACKKCEWLMPIQTDPDALTRAQSGLDTLKDHRKTHDAD